MNCFPQDQSLSVYYYAALWKAVFFYLHSEINTVQVKCNSMAPQNLILHFKKNWSMVARVCCFLESLIKILKNIFKCLKI